MKIGQNAQNETGNTFTTSLGYDPERTQLSYTVASPINVNAFIKSGDSLTPCIEVKVEDLTLMLKKGSLVEFDGTETLEDIIENYNELVEAGMVGAYRKTGFWKCKTSAWNSPVFYKGKPCWAIINGTAITIEPISEHATLLTATTILPEEVEA